MTNSFTTSKVVETPPARTISLDGLILNIALADLGNANTSYTYINMGLDGFNSFSMQHTITATTLTYEATNDLPSVSDASAVWSDITAVVADDSTVVSYTTSGSATVGSAFPWSRLRVKRVTTNANNALQLRLTRNKI